MKCITVINQKGGVGKTTSTLNIATAIASEYPEKTLLMIDLDPQASLTIAAGIEPGETRLKGHSTCDLFDNKKDPLDAVFSLTSVIMENLYIIPSDIDLAETEKELILKMNSEVKLKRAIQKISDDFDYIIIDCPPQLGQLSINALVAADNVIIPCKTDYLSYRGLRALIDTINQIKDEEMNINISLTGIIATMYESNVKSHQEILSMMSEKAEVIGTIRKSADVIKNNAEGVPVVLALPKSKAAEDYRKISEKILLKVQ